MFPRLLTAALLLAALPAVAADVCVSSVVSLQNALTTAGTNDEADVIRVVQGTYVLTGALAFDGDGHPLELLGGYSAGCTSRTLDPNNTIIDGADVAGRTVSFWESAITVEGFFFRDLNGTSGPAIRLGSGPRLVADGVFTFPILRFPTPSYPLRFRHNRVGSSSGSAVLLVQSSGNQEVTENVFHGNQSTISTVRLFSEAGRLCVFTLLPPLCIAEEDFGFDGVATLAGNSFINNGTTTPAINAAVVNPDSTVRVVRSLFAGNGSGALVGTKFFHAQNLLGPGQDLLVTAQGSFVSGSGGNVTGTQTLDANFRPTAMGPALDVVPPAGTPSLDAYGGPRRVGPRVDIGALESSFNSWSTTIVVSNTNDSGPGSLRQALIDANADVDTDRIVFTGLPPACPHTITLATPLPDITQNVVIEGYTSSLSAARNTSATGFNATLCLRLRGTGSTPTVSHALRVNTGANVSLEVSGVAFENYATAAIVLADGTGHVIQGNQFGGAMPTPTPSLLPSARGVSMSGAAGRALIGGDGPGDRNAFAGATASAMNIGGAGDNDIVNNLVGTNRVGDAAIANDEGLRLTSPNNVVRDNRIAGNTNDAVFLFGAPATGNLVRDNVIGLSSARGQPLGNGGAGIRLATAAANNSIWGNVIGNNGASGVRVETLAGNGNFVRDNTLFSNMGIELDLGGVGPTANDPGDVDVGGNHLQNFFAPTSASKQIIRGDPSLEVRGTLDGPAGTYRLHIYDGYSCPGGQPDNTRLLDVGVLKKSDAGVEGFSVRVEGVPSGTSGNVTMTTTNSGNSTSEFSPCIAWTQVVVDAGVLDGGAMGGGSAGGGAAGGGAAGGGSADGGSAGGGAAGGGAAGGGSAGGSAGGGSAGGGSAGGGSAGGGSAGGGAAGGGSSSAGGSAAAGGSAGGGAQMMGSGCGCTTTSPVVLWPFALLLAFFARRRVAL